MYRWAGRVLGICGMNLPKCLSGTRKLFTMCPLEGCNCTIPVVPTMFTRVPILPPVGPAITFMGSFCRGVVGWRKLHGILISSRLPQIRTLATWSATLLTTAFFPWRCMSWKLGFKVTSTLVNWLKSNQPSLGEVKLGLVDEFEMGLAKGVVTWFVTLCEMVADWSQVFHGLKNNTIL